MRIMSNTRAVSTLIVIILLLCSVVFGAFLSYLLVMSNYYNMPENTTLLIVEDLVFPLFDATYFNVTILNPSNSASDVNITAIRLSVEEEGEVYTITATEPERLPVLIQRGTRLTLKCEENWSHFAGETVRVEPVAENASTKSQSYTTPKVKLILTPDFDPSQSVEYFNLTIKNSAESNISLTISEIRVLATSINVTPALPCILSPNRTEVFRCDWNWKNYLGENITINVKTAEGYESAYTTRELPGAILYIDKAKFYYTDTKYFNLTIKSSQHSTATADIREVNLTLPDKTTITLNTTPPLYIIPIPISPNQSLNLGCLWDWNNITHRNQTITISVYTKQGFTVHNKTVTTPPPIVWNITHTEFDLDHTDHLLVNITNMPCSLRNITITQIKLNGTGADFESQIVPIGEEKQLNCTLDWKDFVGKNVTVTIQTEDELNISRIVTIPQVQLGLSGEPGISEFNASYINATIPYVNITISNSNNSRQNVTITKIIFETETGIYEIDYSLTYSQLTPDGHIPLGMGEEVTVVCLWNWGLYLGESLTVTVRTAEGFQASRTWQI